MKRLLITVTAALVLWAIPADAQTCMGNLTFEQARTRAGGQVTFSSDSHSFAGGVGRGYDDVFVLGGLVYQGFSDGGGSNKGFFGQVGTERAVGPDKKYFVCPTAGLAKTSWTSPDDDFSESILALDMGASVGFQLSTTGTTAIIPTFGAYFSHLRSSFEDFDTNTESFLMIRAGVGLLLNEKTSVVPMISFALLEGETHTIFGATVTFKIGQ